MADQAEVAARHVNGPVRETLRRLELEVTRRLDGLLHGDHRGLASGHGTELGETRRYEPGDDVRRIDWNVSARLPDTYIRQTIAERELQTWLIVDQSARLSFGTQEKEKRYLSLAASAAIAHLTNQDGNRLGAVLASAANQQIIKPGGSRKHLLRILHTMASAEQPDGSGATDLTAAVHRCRTVARRTGLVAIISDFNVIPGWRDAVGALAGQHDVIAIQVTDPREFSLPNVGLITLEDPATGRQVDVPTQKKSVRDAYSQRATARQNELVDTLRKLRVDHVQLSTDKPWLMDLARFVQARKHRLSQQVQSRL